MATNIDNSEAIESFLERLKLPDKYVSCFQNNGYHTVRDCFGLDEARLKEMGVTLPGHYRRILNKLPGCSVAKPPRSPKMDNTLSFPPVNSDQCDRSSPGLQILPSATDKTAEARIEHKSVELVSSLPSPELVEDPYLAVNVNQFDDFTTTTEEPLRPLTPPPFESPSSHDEDIYESALFADPRLEGGISSQPVDVPYPSEPPAPVDDDIYLFPSPPKIQEEDPYMCYIQSDPSSEYNLLNENVANGLEGTDQMEEDAYNHLGGNATGASSISKLVATIYSAANNSLHNDSVHESELECEYDRLNSDGLSSPRKEMPSSPVRHNRLTPKDSSSLSRNVSHENNGTEQQHDALSRTHSAEGERSAKNMPLPLPPWKTAVEEKVTLKSLAAESESHKIPLSKQKSLPPAVDDTDFWALDSNNGKHDESEYDTLSLSYEKASFDSKLKLKPTSSAVSINDENEEQEDFYEEVDYPKVGVHNFKLHEQLPQVPHNTPSHCIDTIDNDEETGSYEEVTFLPIDQRNLLKNVDTTLRVNVDIGARERSMTASSKMPKEPKKARRFTGVHALQKAKAVVTKRKPKRNALQDFKDSSFSDNESEESNQSSRTGSFGNLNKSLEDITTGSNLPPSHPNLHQRQPSDGSSGSFGSGNPPGIKPHRLSRVSPVARRKRMDALSCGGSMDLASDDTGIYEELDPRRGAIDVVSPADIEKLNKARQNALKPTKPARQRPVSVFMRPSQENLGMEDRSRTYSATLKRDVTPPTNADDDEFMDVNEFLKRGSQVIPVSPLTKKKTKSGWLLKQGGHEGRAPLRKRWAMFDGDELAYYESDTKTDFAKGILPVEVMNRLQVPPGNHTIFHLQMKGGRTFIFHAENSDDRAMWTSTLMAAILTFQQQKSAQHQLKPGGNMFMPYKEGLLKMEGMRQKIYMAIKGDQAVYYKSKNEFIFAQPIARLQMKLATVKDMGNKKFQVVFPYRIFTFTADSEEEKKLWIEPLREAIAEGLSDYQVLNEIWANESNKKCADCGRAFPDWASINLAIVICKHCAGVHRELGVHNSKVRSLKMDIKIWEPKMKRLLIDIGNAEANNFWIYNLSSSDGITDMADKNQRSWFINSKYIDMNYTRDRKEEGDQELLNQSLIDAVRTDNLIEAYHVTFSGADINCNTGKEYAKTPQLLAEHLTYTTLAEFLHQNGGTDTISPMGHITDRNTSVRKKNSIPKTRQRPPVCLKDFLFKYGGDFKNTSEDTKTKGKFNLIISALQPGDFQKRLCVLENNNLRYCDPEKPTVVKDFVSCNDLISITVHTPEQAIKAGYKHCFEVSRTSGRTYLFCAEREDTRVKWTRGLLQAIVPPHIQDSMQTEEEYERIGKIKIKAKRWSKADTEWSTTWCCLRKKKLQYFHNESRTMETIDLRRLVQITVDQTRETTSNHANTLQQQNKESIPIIMLVFRDKSYYIQSDTRPDSESWMAAIRRADNVSGPTLEEKQLTTEGVPVVLEKCVTYVEQFGIAMRGIYRLSGTHSKTTQLLSDFRQNARETQMREGQMNVHDVANALKRWFKSLPGSLLTESLHEQWIETAQIRPEHHDTKLEWYKHLLEKLPDINRATLKMLLTHLRNVADHEKENEMSLHNLAIVFGPTLLEPQDENGPSDKYLGQTSQEIACIEDLLQFYDWLFDVTDTDREKERRMQAAKEKINQATIQQNMLTTMDYDMMVPIYINRREDRCVNYKVNLSAGQLISKVCQTHGYPSDLWGLYEVIMDGDVERPLHYTEHVLSVIKSWDMPSTNYLLAKNDYIRGKMTWFKQAILGSTGTMMEGQLRVYDGKKKWPKVSGCVYKDVATEIVYFKYFKTTADSTTLDFRDIHKRKRSIKAKGKLIGWSKLGSNGSDPLAKTPVSMPVTTFNVYVGLDKKAKPPPQTSARQAFTIIQVGEAPKYFVAETEGELYRWISHMLISMHPEGFTPPVTQESSPVKTAEESKQSKSSLGRSPFGSLSQQDLGAQVAAKVASLKRNPSNESTGSARDNYLDRGRTSSTDSLTVSTQGANTPSLILEDAETSESDVYQYGSQDDLRPKRTDSGASADFPNRPNQLTTDSHTRRPMLYSPLSPVDPRNQQRAGLGIQLQDELSNVLKKKRPQ